MDSFLILDQHQEAISQLKNEGICVFKNKISPEKMQKIIEEIHHIKTKILDKIQHMPRPLRVYSDIAERELGRLDFGCGFTAEIFRIVGAPIIEFIKSYAPAFDLVPHWGSLTAFGGSGPTNFHRDVYPFGDNSQTLVLDNFELNLPPYYITVLMPLVQITRDNGPTEFVKSSHRKKSVDLTQEKTFAPLLSPGDLVIFDGRTIHRGNANQTNSERAIAALTFIANWYSDVTFVNNDFLFPELRE